MAKDVNIIQVSGTVSSEPELQYTNDGIEQTTMLLTSQRTVRRAEGIRTETEQFFDCHAEQVGDPLCGATKAWFQSLL